MSKTRDDRPIPEPHLETEAALIQAAVRGDGESARQIVYQHLGAITRFAFRMLGDAAEAEDVAQETFLRLWRDLPRWEPRAKLATWLHRVAHNLCIDRMRGRRTVSLDTAQDQEDPHSSAVAQLEDHQRTLLVAAAHAALPERQRAAIALVYHEGMSNRDAAEVLGVEVDALESLLARGRQNLRKQLVGLSEGSRGG
jgi:RNA polymerase sigma-70 factor (ECF subfamily)